MHQVGNKLAFAGYAYENTVADILPDGLAGVVVTEGTPKADRGICRKLLSGNSCVKGGAGGLSFIGSSVMGPEDMIDLRVSYRVKPFASLMGFDGFFCRNVIMAGHGQAMI